MWYITQFDADETKLMLLCYVINYLYIIQSYLTQIEGEGYIHKETGQWHTVVRILRALYCGHDPIKPRSLLQQFQKRPDRRFLWWGCFSSSFISICIIPNDWQRNTRWYFRSAWYQYVFRVVFIGTKWVNQIYKRFMLSNYYPSFCVKSRLLRQMLTTISI